jgi:hypothetical protein
MLSPSRLLVQQQQVLVPEQLGLEPELQQVLELEPLQELALGQLPLLEHQLLELNRLSTLRYLHLHHRE